MINELNELITSLWFIHNFTRISIIWWSEFACLTAGWSVSCIPMCVSVCLPVDVCSSVSVCLYRYVSMCLYVCQSLCLSVGLSVGCLSGGWSECFSFSQSVCLHLSVCLFACLRLSISVCLCVSVSVVGRSIVGLPQLSVSHGLHEACRYRRGGGLHVRR